MCCAVFGAVKQFISPEPHALKSLTSEGAAIQRRSHINREMSNLGSVVPFMVPFVIFYEGISVLSVGGLRC